MPVSIESVSTSPAPIPKASVRRVFLAIPMSGQADFQSPLERLCGQLANLGVKGKWTSPRQAHFTLLFLGDRSEEEINLIRQVSRRVSETTAAFKLSSGAIASFSRRPRLLFLDWHEHPVGAFTQAAVHLRRELAATVTLDSAAAEQMPRPHLTLVRFRRSSDSVPLRSLQPVPSADRQVWYWPGLPRMQESIEISCRWFGLIQSSLTRQGPIYTEIDRFHWQPDSK